MNKASRLMVWIFFVSSLFFAFTAEAAWTRENISFTPTGRVSNNVAFKMTFKDAIVSQGEVGQALPVSDFPFVVTPQIQAEGKWVDQHTFSASLLAPLEMATAYTASVKSELKTLRGRKAPAGTYAFQTAPLSLLSARATATRNNEIDLQLDFNIPVSPARLRGFLSIAHVNGRGTEFRLSGVAAKTLHVAVPVNNLNETVRLNMRLAAGLVGEVGSLGLERAETRQFTIKPVLRIDTIFADEDNHHVYVDTNLAVDLEVAASFIKVEPEVPFTLDSYYRGRFFIRGDFKPRERYTFTFKKGLPAQGRGTVLEQDHVQALIMPDFPPSIDLPASGMFPGGRKDSRGTRQRAKAGTGALEALREQHSPHPAQRLLLRLLPAGPGQARSQQSISTVPSYE